MQTVCRCPVDIFFDTPMVVSSNRRLQIINDPGISSVVDLIGTTQIYSSSSETVTTEFLPLFPDTPTAGVIVYATFGCVFGVVLLALFFSFYMDDSDVERDRDITAVLGEEPGITHPQPSAAWDGHESSRGRIVRKSIQIISTA